MKYAVAVSGGIDSVVLLDLMARKKQIGVVLHVDHGMRDESRADARFVEMLAKKYGAPFEGCRKELSGANEAVARRYRYNFLLEAAKRYGARLATAHHLDDVVESIALNILRGTRWRGLAVLGDERIARPLTRWTKQQLREYAVRNRLEWVEDETNILPLYTRNRIRKQLAGIDNEVRQEIHRLWQRQLDVAEEIHMEVSRLVDGSLNRYFFISIDMPEGVEILAEYIRGQFNVSLLSLQLERAAMALKTGRPGTTWQLGGGLEMKLSTKTGIIRRVDLGRKDFSEYGSEDAEEEWQE